MKAIYKFSLVATGLVIGSLGLSHAADSGVGTGRSFKGPVGLQLYSLRAEFADKGVAELLIRKQRNGPIGMVKLAFLGQYTRFENLAFDQYGGEFE